MHARILFFLSFFIRVYSARVCSTALLCVLALTKYIVPSGIATLEETVADLNAASIKPCDYCADYEYKVVVMQEEVRKAQQQVRDTEAKVAIAVADVEKRVDEATLRNSRHLMRSMDDLERKMALKANQQLMAQDEQNKANTAVIREALDKQVGLSTPFLFDVLCWLECIAVSSTQTAILPAHAVRPVCASLWMLYVAFIPMI